MPRKIKEFLGWFIFCFLFGALLTALYLLWTDLARPEPVVETILEIHHEAEIDPDWHVTWMWATGYAPLDNKSGTCTDGDPTKTATGTYPTWGTIAVNPKIIPYGTKMYVEGYGWGVAEDTGAAIRARTDLIDLYFDTYEQAMAWGRRQVMVVIAIED